MEDKNLQLMHLEYAPVEDNLYLEDAPVVVIVIFIFD